MDEKILSDLFTPAVIQRFIFGGIGIGIFIISYMVLTKILKKFAYPKMKPNSSYLVTKLIKYAFYVIIIFLILGLFNIKLTALFGAAGIAGIAIGFAAQTSFSNIISGLFLLTEHALTVGDYITIGTEAGTIDSINMLSVRIHTPDNQYIRIPNESIINANLKNSSYFSTRRFSLNLTIPYEVDLNSTIKLLESVPKQCNLGLLDPAPKVFVENFEDSGINLTLTAWTKSDNFLDFKNQLFIAVKETLDQNNIKIPYKKLDLVK